MHALSSLAVSSWSLFVRDAFSEALLASARWRRASKLFCAAADERRAAFRSARTRGFLPRAAVRLVLFKAASRPSLA